MCVVRDSQKFSGHPYIGRLARSSLRLFKIILQRISQEIGLMHDNSENITILLAGGASVLFISRNRKGCPGISGWNGNAIRPVRLAGKRWNTL